MKGSTVNAATKRRFCRYYLLLANAAEAAIRAGVPPDEAEAEALAILQSPCYRSYLSELAAQPPLPMQTMVLAGLTRLAFGSANDAARLVFDADEQLSPEVLRSLDLFHVSELKRDKGGGVEIKLFDRQKAMEKLLEFSHTADSSAAASALLAALRTPQEVNADDSIGQDASDHDAALLP